jgi:hypothetical protein
VSQLMACQVSIYLCLHKHLPMLTIQSTSFFSPMRTCSQTQQQEHAYKSCAKTPRSQKKKKEKVRNGTAGEIQLELVRTSVLCSSGRIVTVFYHTNCESSLMRLLQISCTMFRCRDRHNRGRVQSKPVDFPLYDCSYYIQGLWTMDLRPN